MPRKRLLITDEFPYHVTNRSNNREFFDLPLSQLWDIFLDVLMILTNEYGCKIMQLVLMSNHYHLVLQTPQKNLSECMLYFHREVAKRANFKSKRINHFFGGRYKWCVILQEDHFFNTVKYVFRNPVEAGLCTKVEDYAYSSLNYKHPIFWLSDFFYDQTKTVDVDLDWLNYSFHSAQKDAIRSALKKRYFKIPKDRDRQVVLLGPCPVIRTDNNASPPVKVLGTF
jgi:REP element-mobilizing transposase RayT